MWTVCFRTFIRLSFRRFVGLGFEDATPDHSTISRFRTELGRLGLAREIFAEVNRQQLDDLGLVLMHGTIMDATLVDAQRGGLAFGAPADAGVANVNESDVAEDLVSGDESAVYGDRAYYSRERSRRLRSRGVKDRIMKRACEQAQSGSEAFGEDVQSSDIASAYACGEGFRDIETLINSETDSFSKVSIKGGGGIWLVGVVLFPCATLPPLWIADQVRNDGADAPRPVDSRLRGNDGVEVHGMMVWVVFLLYAIMNGGDGGCSLWLMSHHIVAKVAVYVLPEALHDLTAVRSWFLIASSISRCLPHGFTPSFSMTKLVGSASHFALRFRVSLFSCLFLLVFIMFLVLISAFAGGYVWLNWLLRYSLSQRRAC